MKRLFALVLILVFLFNNAVFANEYTKKYLENIKNEDIKTGDVSGEWLILGKIRSSAGGSFDTYYNNLCDTLNENKGDLGRKYTEYSRVIIALTAMGKNPYDVGGYNLAERLEEFDNVIKQGINGAIYAVIATKCGGYKNKECENYLSYILSKQNNDGSFSLSGEGDLDITSMALQALSFYAYRENVKDAIEKAILWLNGREAENAESYAQMLCAYSALGEFTERSEIERVYNRLMEFAKDGGFCHQMGQGSDQMASEQAMYAIAAYERYCKSESSLYDINNNKVMYLK